MVTECKRHRSKVKTLLRKCCALDKFQVTEGQNMRDWITRARRSKHAWPHQRFTHSIHSLIEEVQTKMAVYMQYTCNSNLEIAIAGFSCHPQKYIISVSQIDNKHNIASFSRQFARRLHENQTIIVLGNLWKQLTFRHATTGFPAKITSGEKVQKFHSYDITTQNWVVLLIGWSRGLSNFSTNEKHYSDLASSEAPSELNFRNVFQTLFYGETSSSTMKCWNLLYQAIC